MSLSLALYHARLAQRSVDLYGRERAESSEWFVVKYTGTEKLAPHRAWTIPV